MEKLIPLDERVMSKYMTKYEKARVLGTRATQISQNSKLLLSKEEACNISDPLELATKELLLKRLTIVIRRYLPDGNFEDWPVNELLSF